MSQVSGVSNQHELQMLSNNPAFEGMSPEEIQKSFDLSGYDNLKDYEQAIETMSSITGFGPDVLAGVINAESRGNVNEATGNSDGSTDIGLMQISPERFQSEVVGWAKENLTPEQISQIEQMTGKPLDQLDMSDPEDNIAGGSLELMMKRGEIEQKYPNAAPNDVLGMTLRYYNTGEINNLDPNNLRANAGPGSESYVDNVLEYAREITAGEKLKEDPMGK